MIRPCLDRVRRYSEWIADDIVGLADGAALLHTSAAEYRCVGQAVRFRNGAVHTVETVA